MLPEKSRHRRAPDDSDKARDDVMNALTKLALQEADTYAQAYNRGISVRRLFLACTLLSGRSLRRLTAGIGGFTSVRRVGCEWGGAVIAGITVRVLAVTERRSEGWPFTRTSTSVVLGLARPGGVAVVSRRDVRAVQ